MLRGFALVSGGLALALAVLGFAPGYERQAGCFVEAVPVASAPLGLVAAMAVVGGLAAYVWRRPLIANALLASMVSIGASGFALALTAPPFSMRDDGAAVTPEAVLASRLVLALVVVQIVLLPVACGLFALVARGPDRAPLARARVHRLGRR